MANRFYGYQYDTNPKKLNPENAPHNNRYPQMKKKNLSNLSIPEQRKKELEERQRKDRVNKKEYQENNKKSSQSKKVEPKKTESKRVGPKKVETKKSETKKAESKKIGKRALYNQEKNNATAKKEMHNNNENISIKPADKRETKAKIVAISFILTVFSVLFAISYQNSLISESFNIKEQYKKEYESLSKTNQQIEVGIQNNLNLNNIEKAANDRLGMQKLNNNQKIYVSLPKQDYIAPATEQIIENKETGFFEHFVNIIFNHSK